MKALPIALILVGLLLAACGEETEIVDRFDPRDACREDTEPVEVIAKTDRLRDDRVRVTYQATDGTAPCALRIESPGRRPSLVVEVTAPSDSAEPEDPQVLACAEAVVAPELLHRIRRQPDIDQAAFNRSGFDYRPMMEALGYDLRPRGNLDRGNLCQRIPVEVRVAS